MSDKTPFRDTLIETMRAIAALDRIDTSDPTKSTVVDVAAEIVMTAHQSDTQDRIVAVLEEFYHLAVDVFEQDGKQRYQYRMNPHQLSRAYDKLRADSTINQVKEGKL